MLVFIFIPAILYDVVAVSEFVLLTLLLLLLLHCYGRVCRVGCENVVDYAVCDVAIVAGDSVSDVLVAIVSVWVAGVVALSHVLVLLSLLVVVFAVVSFGVVALLLLFML